MDEIKFEWDSNKFQSNLKKHGVSFEDAKSVFYDEKAIQFYDDSHSQLEEDRFLMLGMSRKSKILLICHCFRESDSVIRIFSARKATTNEEKLYWR